MSMDGSMTVEESEAYLSFHASQIESLTVYSYAGRLSLAANSRLMEAFAEDERQRTAAPKAPLPEFDIKSTFEGLAGFTVAVLHPNIKLSFIEIINRISVREDSIINVIRLSKALDMIYFKYCIARFRAHHHENNKFVQKRLRLLQRAQNEYCVALAHYRSATIDCLVVMQKYKKLCQTTYGTEGKATIYWNNENYILKMRTDILDIMKSHTTQLWLGFEPNSLLVPPTDHHPGNSSTFYARLQSEYHDWLQQHKIHKRKYGKNYTPKSWMKLSTYEDYQESKDQLDAFENDINQQDQEEEEGKKKQGYEGEEVHDGKIALNAHYAAEVGEEKTKDNDDSENKANDVVSTASPSSNIDEDKTVVSDFEWRCLKSYVSDVRNRTKTDRNTSLDVNTDTKIEEIKNIDSDNKDEYGVTLFWNDLDHDKNAAHAAAGLPETFPRIYLVPPLPKHIHKFCEQLDNVIALEEHITANLSQELVRSLQIKTTVLEAEGEEKLNSIKKGERNDEIIELYDHLKHRQQSQNGKLVNNGDKFIVTIDNKEADIDHDFFLTTIEPGFKKSTKTLPLQVKIEKIANDIADKVDASRNKTMRHKGHLVIKPGMRRSEEGKERLKYDIMEAAIMIHRLAQFYLRRKRAIAAAEKRKKQEQLEMLQRVARGFVGRIRARNRKKQFSLEHLILRKLLLRNDVAARRIARFIRKVSFVTVKAKELAGLDNVIQETKKRSLIHSQRILYDSSCGNIQKAFRGYLGRKRFWQQAFLISKIPENENNDDDITLAFIYEDEKTIERLVSTSFYLIENFYESRESTYVNPVAGSISSYATATTKWWPIACSFSSTELSSIFHRTQAHSPTQMLSNVGGGRYGMLLVDDENEGDDVGIRIQMGGTMGAIERAMATKMTTTATASVLDAMDRKTQKEIPEGLSLDTKITVPESGFYISRPLSKKKERNSKTMTIESNAVVDSPGSPGTINTASTSRARRQNTRGGLSGKDLVEDAKETKKGMRDPVFESRLLPPKSKRRAGRMVSAPDRTFIENPARTCPIKPSDMYVTPCLDDYIKQHRARKAIARSQSEIGLNKVEKKENKQDILRHTLSSLIESSSMAKLN